MQLTKVLRRNELGFLREIIWARLAGTGVHLIEEASGKSEGKISYQEYRIWGIRTLLRQMMQDIYLRILDNLPKEESASAEDLIYALKSLITRYEVPLDIFEKKVQGLTDDPVFWSNMDDMQRFSFILAVFFEALDDARVQRAETAIKLISLPPFPRAQSVSFPKLVKDLGFVWRAREYSTLFNNLCHGGFSNTVRRASQTLLQEYERQTHGQPKETGNEMTPPASPDFDKEVAQLHGSNDSEALEAINHLKKFGERAIGELETVLNHSNEEIANKALEAILELKDVKLDS